MSQDEDMIKCPVCGEDTYEYATCEKCHYQNDGGDFDREYPDNYNIDNFYTLNEALAWYKEGGAELTRKKIAERDAEDQ